ncbi:hypothetical protein DFH11DRAFT_1818387 [Phellopilus nigrolimitatus]|nr:hypothetical protein DFH11DRAFT_1818387 [Phellopilus nigrolimitatus]
MLQTKLFTDSGAGKLIRRNYKLSKHGSIEAVSADHLRQVIHDRDPNVLSGQQSVAGVLNELKKAPHMIYSDEAFDVVAIVSHPDGEVDACVMALPNGAVKPFVNAIDSGTQRCAGGKGSVVVDLSADYRFEDGWTYGLPELYDRSAVRCTAHFSQLIHANHREEDASGAFAKRDAPPVKAFAGKKSKLVPRVVARVQRPPDDVSRLASTPRPRPAPRALPKAARIPEARARARPPALLVRRTLPARAPAVHSRSRGGEQEARRPLRGAVGFDLEWRPSFTPGSPKHSVALVLIATPETILLLQVSAMKMPPSKLIDFLDAESIIKAGVNILGNLFSIVNLYRDFPVSARSCVVDGTRWPGAFIGLARLVSAYESRSLSKRETQLSSWEANLPAIQQHYAAKDAHTGFVLCAGLSERARDIESSYYTSNVINGAALCPDGSPRQRLNPNPEPVAAPASAEGVVEAAAQREMQTPQSYDPLPIISAFNLIVISPLVLSASLEAWKGFFASLRPVYKNLTVNIKTCMGVFYVPNANLSNAMIKYQQTLLPQEERNQGFRKPLGQEDGLPVRRMGDMVSVEQYFQRKFNIRLQRADDLAVVNVGNKTKKTFVPAEFCEIELGQQYAGMLPERETLIRAKYTSMPPFVNAKTIAEQGIKVLGLREGAPPIQGVGIECSLDTAVVPPRPLSPPKVIYSSGSHRHQRILGRLRRALPPVHATYSRRHSRPCGRRARELRGCLGPGAVWCRDAVYGDVLGVQDAAINAIENEIKTRPGHPNIMFVFVSYNEIYPGLKKLCDSKLGITTVCMQMVNTKLGGVNHQLHASSMRWLKNIMLIGMGVTHLGVGHVKGTPSIAAVVASCDEELMRYLASLGLQEHSKEASFTTFLFLSFTLRFRTPDDHGRQDHDDRAA